VSVTFWAKLYCKRIIKGLFLILEKFFKEQDHRPGKTYLLFTPCLLEGEDGTACCECQIAAYVYSWPEPYMHTVYDTVLCMVISLLEIPYVHRI
jgi:hypothetical protein